MPPWYEDSEVATCARYYCHCIDFYRTQAKFICKLQIYNFNIPFPFAIPFVIPFACGVHIFDLMYCKRDVSVVSRSNTCSSTFYNTQKNYHINQTAIHELNATTHINLCPSNNRERNLCANLPDPIQSGIHQPCFMLIRIQCRRQRNRRVLDHGISDMSRLAQNASQTNAGEYVHIVTLPGLICFTVVFKRLIRAARGKYYITIRPIMVFLRELARDARRTRGETDHWMASW